MYSIGIDLGGTNIAVGLCDENLTIIDKISAPTGAGRSPSLIVKDMASLSKKLVDRNRLTLSDLKSIGIASPGTVNPDRGVIEYSNNIRMKDFPIVSEFKQYIDIENIKVANDANAAALGEALAGCGKGARGLVMITLGTGVGGGIIIDGKIYTGTVNTAGAEIGHTVIVSRGRQCTCGRRGCFEAYSSASALIKMTEEKLEEIRLLGIDSSLITEAELIICDEPTSALDVSVHSQICNLLLDLQQEFELTYLFISHNLSLIKHITDHMAVMYLGEVMESGSTDEIFADPRTPYTEALMSAILEVNPTKKRERIILSGEARSPLDPPATCRFVNRCPKACDICRTQPLPPAAAVGADHLVRCHFGGKEL